MQFVPVKREDIPVRTREGSVSTALLQGFIDSGEELAVIDTTGHDKTLESVRATISNYTRRHTLPIKVFSASGKLYLERNEGMVDKYRQLNAAALAKTNSGNGTQAQVSDASDEESE